MDRQAIQEIIDSLDVQLAAGKIDLETHRKLTAKWQARLAACPTTGATQDGGPATAEIVSCPECSAPLDDLTVASGAVVRCSFCRATFTLKRAQERAEQDSLELRRWLQQMVVDSAGGEAVDTASRRFIFGEKLFPALQLDCRRGLESYGDVHQHPLVFVDLLAPLAQFRVSDHLLLRVPDSLPKVRALSLKVNSPLVASFAVADDDRRRLRALDYEATSLVFLANVANQLSQGGAEAYGSAKQNLMALSKVCSDYLSLGHDPGYEQYLRAVRLRLEANARVLDVLSTIFVPDADLAPQVFQEELEAANGLLQDALDTAANATHSALALMPLRTGLQRDMCVLQVIQATLACYHTASQNRARSFTAFYSDLKALLDAVCPRPAGADELVSALQQIDAMLAARRGAAVLHTVGDWSWREAQIEAGRKKSLFGGGEALAEECCYWHPFWCATIRYTVAKGALFVSGVEQSGYGLVDATAPDVAPVLALAKSPFRPALDEALADFHTSDDRPLLPALLAPQAAEQALAVATRDIPDVRNVEVNVRGLVYVPAVVAEYQSKAGRRQALYAMGLGVSQAALTLLPRIEPFFARYG